MQEHVTPYNGRISDQMAYSGDQLGICEVKLEIDVAEEPRRCWRIQGQRSGTTHLSERSVSRRTTSCKTLARKQPATLTNWPQKDRNQDMKEPSVRFGAGHVFQSEVVVPASACREVATEGVTVLMTPTHDAAGYESFLCSSDGPAGDVQGMGLPSSIKEEPGDEGPTPCSPALLVSDNASDLLHVFRASPECHRCSVTFVLCSSLELHLALFHGETLPKLLSASHHCGAGYHDGGNAIKWCRYSKKGAGKRKKDGRKKPLRCDVCGKNFFQTGWFELHMKSHSGEKLYVCEVCRAAFVTRDRFEAHMKSHKRRKPPTCDLCGKTFAHNCAVKNHRRIHTGEKPYSCDICGAAFNVKGSLKRHNRVHTGEKPYACDLCDAAFAEAGHLTAHKRIHTGEKPYTCDMCDAAFRQSSDLKTHKKFHTGERSFVCDVCGAAFFQSGALTRHKRSLHTRDKPYPCDICGTAFSENSSLKSHRRTHTGEKPYTCDICGFAMTTKSALIVHRRLHTGEKPYKCICGMAFTESCQLTRHRRSHTGERPFVCTDCGKAYVTSSYLKIHRQIHTGKKPYPCPHCPVAFDRAAGLKKHKQELHQKPVYDSVNQLQVDEKPSAVD